MDAIEGCYFAFRQRLMSIQQASICECSACALIPSLNLKLVAHHGTVVIHKVAGRSELVGSDVIMVHRLLKNTISENAYAFISDACMDGPVSIPRRWNATATSETYEHVGEVQGGLRTWNRPGSLSGREAGLRRREASCLQLLRGSSRPRPRWCGSTSRRRISGRNGGWVSIGSTRWIRPAGAGQEPSTIACTGRT